MMLYLRLMLIALCFSTGRTACPGNIGNDPPSSRAKTLESDGVTGRAFFMVDATLTITCCGVVTGFTVNPGRTGTLYYQIYKPTTTANQYEVVGQVDHVIVAGDLGSDTPITLTTSNQITVENGYKFGWWTSGEDIVKHKDVGSANTYSTARGSLTVGELVDWSTPGDTKANRDYGVIVTVAVGNPSFTNLPDTSTSIPDSTALSTTVFTISYSGDSVTMATDTYFQVNQATGAVSVLSSLAAAPSPAVLSFTVTDGCTDDTQSLTITITNDLPVISSLPASGDLHVDTTAATLLHTLVVTDTADTPSCSLASTIPAGGPFSYLPIPAPSTGSFGSNISSSVRAFVQIDYGIYSNTNPSLTATSYIITISCSDDRGSVTADFTLTILPNEPPVFANLPNTTSISANDAIGTTVFTALATDPEGDALIYTMTCTPATCPFTLHNSGLLQTNVDISASQIAQYTASVYVDDSRNTPVGPSILTIDVTDINFAPTVDNLPLGAPLAVRENRPVSTPVYDVACSDVNVPAQTIVYTMTGTPGIATSYFTINNTNGLITTTSTTLDYEALSAASSTSFTMVIACSDGIMSSDATLTLTVTDENEGPAFSQGSYSLSASEGSAGASVGLPGFGVTDPDSGDTAVLSLDCGTSTGYFLMDASTGEVTFASDYSLDSGSRPSTVSCTVTATDRGSLTSTCALTLQISAVNNNSPIFTATAYTFFASQGYDVDTVIGAVTATDADSGTDGDVSYTLHNSAVALQYFGINGNGEIYVREALTSFNESQIISFNARASDIGGNEQTTGVTIVIYPTTTTSTTPPGDRFKTCSEDPVCVGWITAVVILLLFIIGVTCWMAHEGHLPKPSELWKSFCHRRNARRGGRSWKLNRRPRPPHRNLVVPRRTRLHPAEKPARPSIETHSHGNREELVEEPMEMFEFWREKDNQYN